LRTDEGYAAAEKIATSIRGRMIAISYATTKK
jgi:hypothetical protein